MKLIGNIVAAILFFFGVLFMWGAFSPTVENQVGTLITGVILVMIGLPIAWYVNRKPLPDQKVTYEVELSGDVNLENFQCRQCGGALSSKNVRLVGGALNVECPYCGAVYQVEEKPKW
jgi:ribosomal protein S27AE